MKPSSKFLIRPVILFFITLGLVYFFYIMPGYSKDQWTALYNAFSALVLIGAVVLYTIAIRDAYSIRALNHNNIFPSENKKWMSIWDQYEGSFLANQKKTTVAAQSYFNPDNLLAASLDRIPVLAIIRSMPGTYTGLGILGTFMGFAAGLKNFNTEDIDKSINMLLAGINTAFNTSIVGVVLSICFNFLFLQPLLKRLEQDCNTLTDRIDREFYIDTVDGLKQLFSFEDDGQIWDPRDYNKQMLKELRSQTVSMANFTTDLSDSIQNLAEALVASYRQEMNRIVIDDLKPILNRLADAADKLQDDKAKSADSALEGIIDRLNHSLSDFMKDFKENVSGQTKMEMEGLAHQLKMAGESMGAIPDLMDSLKSSFSAMTEDNLKAMNDVALQGSALQSESISELKILAEQVKLLVESYKEAMVTSEAQNTHSEKIASNLQEVADATSSAITELRRSFSDFQTQNGNLAEKIAKEAEELRVSVASVQSAAQGFNGLDEALAKSFEVISEGLREYRDTTKDGLEKYLESYANTFSQFASKLSGAVEQLGEMVEELQSTIEKRSGK